ncbi:MAG: hypothetical protein ACRDPL_17845 [Propionibacteriaceae bacterium]
MAAGLFVPAPETASAGSRDAHVFMHSAKSGELSAGRLTLRGVSRQVSWANNRGRTGVIPIKRLHRLLFLPGTPPATGMLHVAGDRGGDELALKLSRPRYNASRRTVSYRAKRLGRRALPRRPARGSGIVPRRFGAASLSIIGAPPVMAGDSGGNECVTFFENKIPGTVYGLRATSFSKGAGNTWIPNPTDPTVGAVVGPGGKTLWEADGASSDDPGCSNIGKWEVIEIPTGGGDPISTQVTITFSVSLSSDYTFTYSCTSTDPSLFSCEPQQHAYGFASWFIGTPN